MWKATGRENLFEELDTTRTIGWFTTIHPVHLELKPGISRGAALKSVKEQLLKIPNRGIGFGLLRYLDAENCPALVEASAPQVLFNYLGQFDQIIEENGYFSLATESGGPTQSGGNARSHLLVINSFVRDGRFALNLSYSDPIHKRATMEALAERVIKALRDLILQDRLEDAGDFTPSDFPLAVLTQEDLDRMALKERKVEDVYALSPTQEGILFHTLFEPEDGMYLLQFCCTLTGKRLEAAAFQEAWTEVVQRHTALRASFVWSGLARPLQIVHRQVDLPWDEQDLTGFEPKVQHEIISCFLSEDRARSFDLKVAPLIRFKLFGLPRNLTISSGRAITSCWTAGLFLSFRDVLESFKNARDKVRTPGAEAVPYREFIAWLQRQDMASAEKYWRKTLHNFRGPVAIRSEQTGNDLPIKVEQAQVRVSRQLTEQLRSFARETSANGQYADSSRLELVLSRYGRTEDVVFGITTSGRPAELTGIERMVGLFITTLPVRVQVKPELELMDWLQRLQGRR